MIHRSLHPDQRRAVVMLMLCAWLLLQALALLHRVGHAPHADTASANAVNSTWQPWLAHEVGDVDCLVLDQIGHADAVVDTPVSTATLPPVDRWLAAVAGPVLARQAAGFLARGPPVTG